MQDQLKKALVELSPMINSVVKSRDEGKSWDAVFNELASYWDTVLKQDSRNVQRVVKVACLMTIVTAACYRDGRSEATALAKRN
jgi:hypothetical protein